MPPALRCPTWGPPIGNAKPVLTALGLPLFSRPMIRVLTNTKSAPSHHFCHHNTANHPEAKQADSPGLTESLMVPQGVESQLQTRECGGCCVQLGPRAHVWSLST